MIMQALFTETE